MGLRSSVLSWLGKAKTDRIAVWNMPWIGDAALKAGNVPALLDAYRSWVYVCASKNATTFASIPLNLYVAKRAGKKLIVPTKSIDRSKLINIKQRSHLTPYLRKAVEYEEVTEHPFLDLMQNVNDFINQFSLFERTELHLELTGNAYWYIVKGKLGLPVEIWPLDPSRVKIIPDKENFIAGYKYQVGQREIVFDESEIVHFKFPHPSDDYYGMAPLEAVTAAYNINEQMAIYDSHVLKNGGRLEGYFANMGDRRLSEVEFDRLKREIKENYTGSINAGRSPLLDGIEYRPFALPPKDLNFAQGRRWSKEEICNAFGQSLGMWDKDATRANAENAMYMYMKDTILPRVCRVEQKINEKLCPMYDGDLFVAFDNPVPEDREFRLKEREVNLRTGYSSINLERQEDNLDEVEWGDIPIMAAGMVPLGSSLIGSSPATSQERMVKKKIIDRVKHYEAFVKATDPFEADWVREMQKLFAEQEREVLANMKKTPKAMVNKDVTDTWMFGRKTWEKRFADTGEKLLKAAILANGTRIMNELPVVGISFDIFNELVLDWVNGTKIDFAKEVVGTTIDKLNDAMNAGLEAGESVPDIAKRVRDVFDNATKYRSTMIARTETTASANFGTLESYRQSGVVEGKEWLATMDMRVRDSHAEMDGEVVGIDDVFSNGCSFPGDPAGGAEEAINCRCTMVPKIIEGQE